MKWYNHRAHKAHQYDLKVQRDTHLGSILPHVSQIASTFPREAIAIGALNYQDLIQAGYLGLLEAWDKVDWDKINKSPNPDGQLWSFLKKRIKWAIRREIDKYGQHISTPINKLETARNNLNNKGIDKVLVNLFPKFFDEELPIWDDHSSWTSLQLEEIIEDELYRVERNADHRHIFLNLFGIGSDKLTAKKVAENYKISEIGVKKIKAKILQKLNNEHFKLIIETFYKN